MKATELRIGNLYRYNDLPISSMTSYELNEFYETENKDYDDRDKNYKSIQLTEEWLLKFRFVKRNVYILNDIEIGWADDDFVKNQFTVRYGTKYIKIKYVHSLQNLYFALTSKELTIK